MTQLDDLGTSWLGGGNNPKKPRSQDEKAVSYVEKDRKHYMLLAIYGPQPDPYDRTRKGRKREVPPPGRAS